MVTNPRRRRNLTLWIIAGVILQIAIILLFIFLVMRIRVPKVRIGSITVDRFNLNTSPTSPSLTMELRALVTVKNPNFGHFKLQTATAAISYQGTNVATAEIGKAKVRAWSTKKMNVTFSASFGKVPSLSQLMSDVRSGTVALNGHAEMRGKVVLFAIFKKKKTLDMNCTMAVDIQAKSIKNLKCK